MSEVKIAEDLRVVYDVVSGGAEGPTSPQYTKLLIERVSAAESALAEAKTELERKGGPVFKMFVWRGRPDWIVMCHARTVEEARNLAIEDSRGDGDWSTPVRLRMMKTVRETSPEIHYRECGETVLTANGETEELDLYAKTKDAEIDGLKAENARLCAPVSDEEPDLCAGCDKPLREDEGHETGIR